MKHLSILFLIGISTILIGCNIRHDNHIIDKIEAEEIANQFYYHLQMEDFKSAEKLFSEKAFETNTREDLLNYFKATIYTHGNLSNFVLDYWDTSVIDGKDSRGQYILYYYVTRYPKHTFEKLFLIKENDSIKIVGYEITLEDY